MRAILLASLFFVASPVFASPEVLKPVNGNNPDLISYMEEVPTPANVVDQLSRITFPAQPWDGDLSEATVIVDQIINLGQKIWTIIEKGKPVQDVSYHYANALPRGAAATDLEGFSDLQHKSWRMYGTNGFGMTVYDLTYTVVHRYGGSYNGVGKYLDAVTVLPSDVSTLWGYTTNLAMGNVDTVNVGTKASPVGSLLMDLNFKVSTVIKTSEYHKVFDLRGDSASVTQQ